MWVATGWGGLSCRLMGKAAKAEAAFSSSSAKQIEYSNADLSESASI